MRKSAKSYIRGGGPHHALLVFVVNDRYKVALAISLSLKASSI